MGLKADARAADSWSDPFSLITVIMVKGMMPSKDDHRASLSTLVRTRFLPLAL